MVYHDPSLSGSGHRLQAARKAYASGDVELSKQVHDKYFAEMAARNIFEKSSAGPAAHEEKSKMGFADGKFVKPLVFGGLDGVSTMFAFVAGMVGAKTTLTRLIAVGVANLLAGALGMGFGEYVSSTGEYEVAKREMERETWEMENYPEGEICEMIEIYEKKGLSRDDAITVAVILSKYREFWIEHMMVTEVKTEEEKDFCLRLVCSHQKMAMEVHLVLQQ